MKPQIERHKRFTRYLISNEGQVWDGLSNTSVIPSLNNSEYQHVTIYADDGKRHWVPVHKLVAETFVERPTWYTSDQKLTVNHKNGQKNDNCSMNLEWCTIEENRRHAGLNGLTPKYLPVEIRLVATEEVFRFDSFTSCAEYLGVSLDAVCWRVKSGPRSVHDGYQFRLIRGNEGKPWLDPVGKEVVVRDLSTGKIHLFNTSRDASKFVGASEVTVWNWLRREGQPVLLNRYQIAWLHAVRQWREPSKEEIELGRQRKVVSIEVRNPKTGERRIYASGRECAEALGLKPTALNYRLKHAPEGKVYPDGFSYSYYSHVKE